METTYYVADDGGLHEYETAAYVREATDAEHAASLRAAARDGGAGVIRLSDLDGEDPVTILIAEVGRTITVAPNDPTRAGAPASKIILFGGGRYALRAIHTRHDAVSYFVTDADLVDEVTGGPAIIRIESTVAAAILGVVALGDL